MYHGRHPLGDGPMYIHRPCLPALGGISDIGAGVMRNMAHGLMTTSPLSLTVVEWSRLGLITCVFRICI